MTDAPGDNAYPVTATVFILMYKQPKDEARSKAVFTFFKWALEHGQKQAELLDYVPLPELAGDADRELLEDGIQGRRQRLRQQHDARKGRFRSPLHFQYL